MELKRKHVTYIPSDTFHMRKYIVKFREFEVLKTKVKQ